MKYIALPTTDKMELSFFLAMEEYVAKYIDEESVFFMWQSSPSVIFGRNQMAETEVNIPYCREQSIKMYRRKSGGGCVYSDMNNIMFSYVTKSTSVQFTFSSYIDMIVAMLRSLGVNAEGTGRNDIVVDGKKISGNAFYHVSGKSIVHGTMLFDADLDRMIKAITPSSVKLQSKGIKSVRSRVTTLKQYLDIGIDEFKSYVKGYLCEGEITLDATALADIKKIEEGYLLNDFIYGNNPNYNIVRKAHYKDVGEIEVMLEIKHGKIKDINILGDYFLVGDIDRNLIALLKGCLYTQPAVEEVLKTVEMDKIILNLNKKQFLKLLF